MPYGDVDLAALYARHAKRFDRARTRTLMELPYLRQATTLAPAPGTVLDLGCGSGEPLARYFVENGFRVTGVDLVGEMLEMCRARFPDMAWRQGDMRDLELGERFDIVMAWDSFFHLGPSDQRRMFETFRRHTAPGGVLVFTSGTREGEQTGGDLFGDELYHASLDSQEYERLLDQHGYVVICHRVEDPDCGGHTVWVARLRGGRDGSSSDESETTDAVLSAPSSTVSTRSSVVRRPGTRGRTPGDPGRDGSSSRLDTRWSTRQSPLRTGGGRSQHGGYPAERGGLHR